MHEMNEMDDTTESVVVAVRVRPLSDKENAVSVVHVLPHERKVLSAAGKGYAFDHIFTDDCEQVTVYEESVKPVVKKFCAGFNCAVIAYGQTGTGKTYTIGTDPKSCDEESAGIISQAVKDVILGFKNEGSEVSVEISFMEIYNEEVYDLLTCQSTKLHVKAFSVQNLTRIKVSTCEEATRQLEFGSTNRHTRATKLNTRSSRSHAVFTMYYNQRIGEQMVQSQLDLVDLAGLEGVRNTGCRGIALNEAKNINVGLLHLRNVISVLSTNTQDYISYRSSTLTTVLKDSLSRESYVTMIACISPSNLDVGQTITTLRFAEEAKKVMSKPKVKQILEKYKESNPQEFEYLAEVASYIPPTPAKNLYRMKSPALHVRAPLTPLNISNVTSFSSADSQDCFKKPYLNTLNRSSSNSSISFLSSEVSASTTLDMSTALSPLLKKHMKEMEDRLKESISTRNIMEAQSVAQQARKMLRDDLKEIVDELKTIIEQSGHRARNSVAHWQESVADPMNNVKRKLPFASDETSKFICAGVDSGSDGESSVSLTQQHTVRRVTGGSSGWEEAQNSSKLALDGMLHVTQDDVFKKATRRSVRIANLANSGLFSTPQGGCLPADLSTLSTVKRSRRISKARRIDKDASVSSPSFVTTVRRSERLSIRLVSHNRDKLPILSPSRTSTVRKSARFSCRAPRDYEDETSKSSPAKRSPAQRRSARLSGKAPAYSDEALQRLSSLRRIRKVSYKPALMASPPQELNEQSSMKAREKFKLKALKLLNGSLKDLANFSTVGSKTAVIIYNYRLLLNDCQFQHFEDLKNIPGLPTTYYERFMKANNLW